MVTDDPSGVFEVLGVTAGGRITIQPVPGRTLAELIGTSGSPGLHADRVLRWAGQLADVIDALHRCNRAHGRISPASVIIDEDDNAHLCAAATERDLLLGGADHTPPEPGDDIRALAATLHRAFGGAGADELPARGVGVRGSLALLAETAEGRAARPSGPHWATRLAVVAVVVAAACAAWVRSRPGAGTATLPAAARPGVAQDLLAVDRAIKVAAAERAAAQWKGLVAAAPDRWLSDDLVNAWCDEAHQQAASATEAQRDGRFDEARVGYDRACDAFGQAILLQADGVATTPGASAPRASGPLVETAADQAAAPGLQRAAPGAADPETDLEPGPAAGSAADPPRPGSAVLVNSLSQTLIYMEPGELLMGSPQREPFHKPGELEHRVRLSRGYWIGRIEVTRGQFATFVARTGYVTDAEKQGWSHGLESDGRWRRIDGLSWRDPGFPQGDNHPAVCVSCADALAFCRWLGQTERRAYRLPTEAEWEYACRAGTTTAYAWGDDPFDKLARANAADAAWTGRVPDSIGFPWFDAYVFTSPVAAFPANAWGLFDMYGNVSEWCADVYARYADGGDQVDPTGPGAIAGSGAPRVLRGGSFAAPPSDCRAAHRNASKPDASYVTVGFRVVLEE